MLPEIGTRGKGPLVWPVNGFRPGGGLEKNLDKKMTNFVSYAKLWAAVVREFAGRKDSVSVSVILGGSYE